MKSLKEQKLNKCRHFNGTKNDCCEAGVRYDSVKTERPGWNLPCFVDRGNGEGCDKFELKSEAEVDKEVEEARIRFDGTMEARKAIVAYLGGPWKKGMPGGAGVIDCPVCKGDRALHFTRSSYNGHIHAQCETPDCVSWME